MNNREEIIRKLGEQYYTTTGLNEDGLFIEERRAFEMYTPEEKERVKKHNQEKRHWDRAVEKYKEEKRAAEIEVKAFKDAYNRRRLRRKDLEK